MTIAALTALHCYPLKSAAGLSLASARIVATGIEHDRSWMLVDQRGRCITQRECPRLALLQPQTTADALLLAAPGLQPLRVPRAQPPATHPVRVWHDDCAAFDAGDAVAQALSDWLGRACRLVRFDDRTARNSDRQWTGGFVAANAFSDGFPLLVIGAASFTDLNSRLTKTLPMNRFRPNLVLAGLEPYAEDRIDELQFGELRLRLVKPCTRCAITTTSQERGERDGEEPLRTLRSYRYDASLQGVLFGQNAIIVAGIGTTLRVGQTATIRWK